MFSRLLCVLFQKKSRRFVEVKLGVFPLEKNTESFVEVEKQSKKIFKATKVSFCTSQRKNGRKKENPDKKI